MVWLKQLGAQAGNHTLEGISIRAAGTAQVSEELPAQLSSVAAMPSTTVVRGWAPRRTLVCRVVSGAAALFLSQTKLTD